jgi:hypothetical protein
MKYLTALEKLLIISCENLDLMRIKGGKKEEIQPLSLQTVLLVGLPATVALPTQFLQGSTNSLRIFIIQDCPNIRVIPECFGNLNKLQNLRIIDCSRLSKRCQRRTGEDWPKITHIPKIKVDDDDIEKERSKLGKNYENLIFSYLVSYFYLILQFFSLVVDLRCGFLSPGSCQLRSFTNSLVACKNQLEARLIYLV